MAQADLSCFLRPLPLASCVDRRQHFPLPTCPLLGQIGPAFAIQSSLESPQFRPDTGSRSLAISNPRRTIMAIQIVMDRTGDSRHPFDPNDAQELAKAERRFYELTKVGFTAAIRTGPGQVSQIRSFDPNAEETVFFPRLVGG